MSESPSEIVGASGEQSAAPRTKSGGGGRNPFVAIITFIREVVAELRKVVTLTRSELMNYTLVVIVFVLVVMAFVTGLDYVIGKLTLWVFGA